MNLFLCGYFYQTYIFSMSPHPQQNRDIFAVKYENQKTKIVNISDFRNEKLQSGTSIEKVLIFFHTRLIMGINW